MAWEAINRNHSQLHGGKLARTSSGNNETGGRLYFNAEQSTWVCVPRLGSRGSFPLETFTPGKKQHISHQSLPPSNKTTPPTTSRFKQATQATRLLQPVWGFNLELPEAQMCLRWSGARIRGWGKPKLGEPKAAETATVLDEI